MLGRHVIALPQPSSGDAQLAASIDTLRGPSDKGQMIAVHVLYAECRCSQRIVDHIALSARPSFVHEIALVVGPGALLDDKLASRGIRVVHVASDELERRYHVVAVPMLIVEGPNSAIRYAGGYTTEKQGLEPRDLEIIAEARVTKTQQALPILGCAVSEKLKKQLDPTGLL
jgi:hypothetical protein